MINQRRQELETSIKTLESALVAAKRALEVFETSCNHQWSEPAANHIHHEAFTFPGDAPGTMGVDWRGPVDVPSRTENRWTRVCQECGKIQHTSHAETRETRIPKFYP